MTKLTTIPKLREIHAARLTKEERALVRQALTRNEWSLNAAARDLDVTASSLHRRITKLGLADEYGTHAHGKPGRPRKKRAT